MDKNKEGRGLAKNDDPLIDVAISLLNTTLGDMPSDEADRIVAGVIKLLGGTPIIQHRTQQRKGCCTRFSQLP